MAVDCTSTLVIVLTVVGLVLELIPVIIEGKKAGVIPCKSKKEMYNDWVSKQGKPKSGTLQ